MQAGLQGLPQKLGDTSTLKLVVQNAKVALRVEAQGLLPIVVLDFIYGWDISNWQPIIDWKQVGLTAPDLKYVNIKATEGINYFSRRYEEQWNGAGSIGQLRDAYHYLHTELSGKDQAKYFLSKAHKGELPPMVDVEDAVDLPPYPTTAQAKAAGQSVYEFTDTVANAWGQRVIIYTGPWFWNRLGAYALAASKSCDYFGAAYHALDDVGPSVGIGWSKWTFWQYTSKGTVGGCPDRIDLSVFHGGADVFNKWHGGTVVIPPIQPPVVVPPPVIIPPPVVIPPPIIVPPPPVAGFPYPAHVHNPIYGMYVRSQARADSTKVKWIPDGFQLIIFEEKIDNYGTKWGRMQFGYVSLKYVAKN